MIQKVDERTAIEAGLAKYARHLNKSIKEHWIMKMEDPEYRKQSTPIKDPWQAKVDALDEASKVMNEAGG